MSIKKVKSKDYRKLVKSIKPLAEKLQSLQKRAKELGMFVDDRDLLSCSKCGLEEDVTIHSLLIVTARGKRQVDTGLRFKNVAGSQEKFRCPSCKSVLTANS